jgi:RNA polymerase sigma factor (TIGR02999 family)
MTNLAPDTEEITRLLTRCGAGDVGASERFTLQLYEELQTLASRVLSDKHVGTLHTTTLVHEACARMLGQRPLDPGDRARFLMLAARTMRCVLVDYMRWYTAKKRPLSQQRISIEEIDLPAPQVDLLGLDKALERLSRINPRQAQVVDLKFFAGLGLDEIAQTLDVGRMTVARDWRMAHAWLQRQLDA